MKLMPASSARWMMAIDSSWSGLPQAPNITVPRVTLQRRHLHAGVAERSVVHALRARAPEASVISLTTEAARSATARPGASSTGGVGCRARIARAAAGGVDQRDAGVRDRAHLLDRGLCLSTGCSRASSTISGWRWATACWQKEARAYTCACSPTLLDADAALEERRSSSTSETSATGALRILGGEADVAVEAGVGLESSSPVSRRAVTRAGVLDRRGGRAAPRAAPPFEQLGAAASASSARRRASSAPSGAERAPPARPASPPVSEARPAPALAGPTPGAPRSRCCRGRCCRCRGQAAGRCRGRRCRGRQAAAAAAGAELRQRLVRGLSAAAHRVRGATTPASRMNCGRRSRPRARPRAPAGATGLRQRTVVARIGMCGKRTR